MTQLLGDAEADHTVISARPTTGNRLLASLSANDLFRLEPHLERVSLPHRQVIIPASQPIEHVYFPEGGIIAYRAPSHPHDALELGIIGCEGMVGFSVLLERHVMRAEAVVQIDGTTALRIKAETLLAATRQSPSLQAHLLSFLPGHMLQLAQTGYARGHHTLQERLARLLLLCHDRMSDDNIRVTHEFLANMVASQRSAITGIMHIFEGEGLVRNTRGMVIIRDREGLEDRAGASYTWMG